MVTIYLTDKQCLSWLYYETGFEQLYPIPPIHKKMEASGYEYYRDWRCVKQASDKKYRYSIEFEEPVALTLFLLIASKE